MGKLYPGIHGMRKYISPSLHNSSSILERSRKLEFRNDRLFLGMTRNSDLHYENIFMEDRCYFFFLCRLINERWSKIQMGTMNYYRCLEFNFWNDEKYYFETFLWKMIVTFFFFFEDQ